MKKYTLVVPALMLAFTWILSAPVAEAKSVIPEKENPDACRTIRGKTECKRWYRLPKVLVLEGINFDTGSARIKPESYSILNRNAQLLKDRNPSHIRIVGHTDNVGSSDSNQRLSEARAISVMNYMARKGVSRRAMSAEGQGESQPVVSNDTAVGRAKNRRIEIHLK